MAFETVTFEVHQRSLIEMATRKKALLASEKAKRTQFVTDLNKIPFIPIDKKMELVELINKEIYGIDKSINFCNIFIEYYTNENQSIILKATEMDFFLNQLRINYE